MCEYSSVTRYAVGILGATGLVGQRLVERLAAHPWFVPVALGASERSAGRPYGEVARWLLSEGPPPAVAGQVVRRCEPQAFADCDLVLSGLDTRVAREIEGFTRAGECPLCALPGTLIEQTDSFAWIAPHGTSLLSPQQSRPMAPREA
jgi:aspartate-semialdehyde dehydrogenase